MRGREGAGVILVQRSTGKVLLQHRTEDAREKPGLWSFFGGRIEAGETPLAAATRELREELCIFLTPHLSLLVTKVVHADDGSVRGSYYFTGLTDYDESWLRRHQQEGQSLGFFSEAESGGLPMDEYDRLVLLIYFDSVRGSEMFGRT